MIKKIFTLFLIIYLQFFIYSFAVENDEDYIEILSGLYLNKESITYNNDGNIFFWLKILKTSRMYTNPDKKDNYSLQYWNVNCLKKTFSILRTHYYDNNNNLISSYSDTYINEPIIPNSFNSIPYILFCKKD